MLLEEAVGSLWKYAMTAGALTPLLHTEKHSSLEINPVDYCSGHRKVGMLAVYV